MQKQTTFDVRIHEVGKSDLQLDDNSWLHHGCPGELRQPGGEAAQCLLPKVPELHGHQGESPPLKTHPGLQAGTAPAPISA